MMVKSALERRFEKYAAYQKEAIANPLALLGGAGRAGVRGGKKLLGKLRPPTGAAPKSGGSVMRRDLEKLRSSTRGRQGAAASAVKHRAPATAARYSEEYAKNTPEAVRKRLAASLAKRSKAPKNMPKAPGASSPPAPQFRIPAVG